MVAGGLDMSEEPVARVEIYVTREGCYVVEGLYPTEAGGTELRVALAADRPEQPLRIDEMGVERVWR